MSSLSMGLNTPSESSSPFPLDAAPATGSVLSLLLNSSGSSSSSSSSSSDLSQQRAVKQMRRGEVSSAVDSRAKAVGFPLLRSIGEMRKLQLLENPGLFQHIQSFLAPMPDEHGSMPYPQTIEMRNFINQQLLKNEHESDYGTLFSYKKFKIWIKETPIRVPDFFEINSLACVTRKCADNFKKINKKVVIEPRMIASKVFIYLNQEKFFPTPGFINSSANGFLKALSYAILERNLELFGHILHFDVTVNPEFIFALVGQFERVLCLMSSEFSEEKQKFCEKACELIFQKIKEVDLTVVNGQMGGLLHRLAYCKRSIGFDWLMARMRSLSNPELFIFKEKLAQANFINADGVSILFTAIKQEHFSIIKQMALYFPLQHAEMVGNLSDESAKKLKNLAIEELSK